MHNIPIEEKAVPCRFGDGNLAVARYETPQGCVCFPDDRLQDLCGQHVIKDGMIGNDVRLIIIYNPDFCERYYHVKLDRESTAAQR